MIKVMVVEDEQEIRRILKKMIENTFNSIVEISKTRGLCSFYAEKGGLLVGFEKLGANA